MEPIDFEPFFVDNF